MPRDHLEFRSSLDDSSFHRTLRKMEMDANKATDRIAADFEEVRKGLGLLSIAAVGGLGVAIRESVRFGSAIADSSAALDLTTDSFQGYVGVLEKGGVSQEKFESGMVRLKKAIEDAKSGNLEMIGTFERLGVTWDQLASGDAETVLKAIASGLNEAADASAAFDAATDIFGKGSQKLVAALKANGSEFEANTKTVSKLTDEQIAKLDALGDSWDSLVRRMKVGISGPVSSLNDLADLLSGEDSSFSSTARVYSPLSPAAKKAKRDGTQTPQDFGRSLIGPKDPRTIAAEKELDEALKKANEEHARERDAAIKKETTETEKLANAWDKIAKITEQYHDRMKEEAQRAQKERIAELTARKTMLQERMQGEMDREHNFNLMSKDEVREGMRAMGRSNRAASRAEREKAAASQPWRKYKDARYGSGDLGGNLVQAAIDGASVKALAKEIAIQVDKLVAAP